jgi:hypothetical protein
MTMSSRSAEMLGVRELSAAGLASLEYGNAAVQAQIARYYDKLLGSLSVGEYGMVPPLTEETRQAVRACLLAAAERRGRQLLFVPMEREGLLFRVCDGANRWGCELPRTRKLRAARLASLEYGNEAVQGQIAAYYDGLLSAFRVGEHCIVQPLAQETRQVVRECLVAAAERRGLQLQFVPAQGHALIFRVCEGVGGRVSGMGRLLKDER